MSLRIGVDGRVLTDRYHGIGRVAYELVREMTLIPGVEVVVFAGAERSRRFDLGALNVSIVPVRLKAVDVRQLWRWRRVLRRSGVDVMFFPYHLGATPLPGRPSVALLHDCILETDPRFVPSRAVGRAYRILTALIARSMTIATVSRASAHEVERFYGRRVEHVIPNGVDQEFSGELPRLADLGLEPGYVLHVGAQRPHKNVGVLVEAIAEVPGARLVLVGSADERFADEVGPAIERHGVEDRVVRLSFVPEDLLGSVYAGAALLAYPSLVEGFGLPMLEAMVAGTPVLASDVPVLREVGGEAALYAPPAHAEAWTAAITRLLADADLRNGLVAAGAAHASRFTWGAAAKRLVSACHSVAGSYRLLTDR
ncbi:glycosyltransferase family 1 protein [Actinoplanes sp. N902-109]|uniref:glycosyltransferase family 4 protein n=1 Tax=Actinoplanes sp. (strain N902-109) TaxID=649831 RepID=UPI00032963A9|nr:glycosyltransferase family 1 protein [Actinoplanes sp. N902-109]AGL20810.1 glycosyltransferase, group 1 [Actinoplanes sp. N902-109]